MQRVECSSAIDLVEKLKKAMEEAEARQHIQDREPELEAKKVPAEASKTRFEHLTIKLAIIIDSLLDNWHSTTTVLPG